MKSLRRFTMIPCRSSVFSFNRRTDSADSHSWGTVTSHTLHCEVWSVHEHVCARAHQFNLILYVCRRFSSDLPHFSAALFRRPFRCDRRWRRRLNARSERSKQIFSVIYNSSSRNSSRSTSVWRCNASKLESKQFWIGRHACATHDWWTCKLYEHLNP